MSERLPPPHGPLKVLAIGLRQGMALEAARAMLASGNHVALYDIGDGYRDDPEPAWRGAFATLTSFPRARHLQAPQDTAVEVIQHRGRLRALLRRASSELGGLDVVYVARLPLSVEHSVLPQLLRATEAEAVASVLITEGAPPAANLARWAWTLASEHPGVRVTVLREPEVPAQLKNPGPTACDPASALVAAGWVVVTREEVDREAERSIRSALDVLAGEMWGRAWMGYRQSHTFGIGDGGAESRAPLGRELEFNELASAEAFDYQVDGIPLIVVRTPDDMGYLVERAPILGSPNAVRVSFDSDSFEYEPYEPVARLRLPSGLLWLGDPTMGRGHRMRGASGRLGRRAVEVRWRDCGPRPSYGLAPMSDLVPRPL